MTGLSTLTDAQEIDGAFVGRSNLGVTRTADGATLSVGGSTFQLVSDFAAGDFLAVARGTGIDAHTTITFERYLPTLSEGVRVNPTLINGIASEEFLTGDGNVEFTLSRRSATSEYRNSLGTYMVAADGTISDVRILFGNTLSAGSASVNLGTPDADEKIGFFLIQDGFDAYGNLPNNLSFVDPCTTTPVRSRQRTAADAHHDLDDRLLEIVRHADRHAVVTHCLHPRRR
jgi:hypothetical protein